MNKMITPEEFRGDTRRVAKDVAKELGLDNKENALFLGYIEGWLNTVAPEKGEKG